MKTKTKRATIAVLVLALLAATLLPNVLQSQESGPEAIDGIKFHNKFTLLVVYPSCEEYPDNVNCGMGPLFAEGTNTVTLLGLNDTRDRLSGLYDKTNSNVTLNNWTTIALSPSGASVVNTQATCPDQFATGGLTAIRGAVVREGTGNYTVSVTFSPTATNSITRFCLQNSTLTTGPLFAYGAITNTTVQLGDSLQANYSLAVA